MTAKAPLSGLGPKTRGLLLLFKCVYNLSLLPVDCLLFSQVFGLIAGLLFAYDTYTIFLQIKSSGHTAASTGGRVFFNTSL